MAENKIIKTLIHKFLKNSVPEETQTEFQTWILKTEEWDEKENVLMEYVESLHPEFDYNLYKNKLKKLHFEIGDINKNNTKSRMLRFGIIAAAASILLAAVTFLVSVKVWSPNETLVYVTSEANKGKFTLPDGSTVYLNASSRLEVPSTFTDKTRNVKLDGEAFFDIVKDSLHPFQVNSHMATVRVLGTAFDMKAYSNDDFTEVVLVRGSVEVTGSKLTKPVVMKPNEKLTLAKDTQLAKIAVGNYISWTGYPLVFENTELTDILTSIGRWYNVEFTPLGNTDHKPHLTFVIKDESMESILKQISLITSFNYTIKEDKVFYTTE